MSNVTGLGHLAGGLARGIMMGQQLGQNADRQRREEEEYQRQQALRRAAGNTFGSVGHTREDGSAYDFQAALGDYSSQAAPHDPSAAVNAYLQGQQLQTAGIQRRGLERQERYAQAEEDVNAFLRRSQFMPDDAFYREAARFASLYGNDGKSFDVEFDANTGYTATMLDTNTGEAFRQPIRSRQEVIDQLLSYASPQAQREARRYGLDTRRVAAAERTAAATEGYRRDQAPVLAAQADMHRAHAGYYQRGGAAAGSRSQEQIVNFVDRRTGEVVPFRHNRATGGFERVSLPEGMSLGLPNQRGQLQALGSTGLLTDGQKAYIFDEQRRQLVEVPMPGETLVDRLRAARAGAGVQPAGGLRMPPARVPQPTGQRIFGPLTPERILQDEAILGNPAALDELQARRARAAAGEQFNRQPHYGVAP